MNKHMVLRKKQHDKEAEKVSNPQISFHIFHCIFSCLNIAVSLA